MTPCTLKEPFVTAAEKKLLMLDSVIPASQKSFLPVYRGWGTEGACIDLVSNTKYKKIHLTAGYWGIFCCKNSVQCAEIDILVKTILQFQMTVFLNGLDIRLAQHHTQAQRRMLLQLINLLFIEASLEMV